MCVFDGEYLWDAYRALSSLSLSKPGEKLSKEGRERHRIEGLLDRADKELTRLSSDVSGCRMGAPDTVRGHMDDTSDAVTAKRLSALHRAGRTPSDTQAEGEGEGEGEIDRREQELVAALCDRNEALAERLAAVTAQMGSAVQANASKLRQANASKLRLNRLHLALVGMARLTRGAKNRMTEVAQLGSLSIPVSIPLDSLSLSHTHTHTHTLSLSYPGLSLCLPRLARSMCTGQWWQKFGIDEGDDQFGHDTSWVIKPLVGSFKKSKVKCSGEIPEGAELSVNYA
ncbi:hypothetical protein KIPB_007513, partial [Kipferlia bialata]|eukprot:g7513.t1